MEFGVFIDGYSSLGGYARDVRLRQLRLGKRKLHRLLGPAFVERGIKQGRDELFDVQRAARMPIMPHRVYHKTTQ
ncbi:hypothetical protein WT63_20250 [Burkholderia anthina]|nr:hypothetical protein WT63_20250 [Burkholderia anthina]